MFLFSVLFGIFILFSIGLVLTNNILLSLVGVGGLFLIYALFLFSLHFYYLAFTIGIIYLGAIIILFVYVIMLINLLTSNYNTLNFSTRLKNKLKILFVLGFFASMVFGLFCIGIGLFNYTLITDFNDYFGRFNTNVYVNWYQLYYFKLFDYINFNVLYMRLEYVLLTLFAAIALFLGLIASIILVYTPIVTNTIAFKSKPMFQKFFHVMEKRTLNNLFIQTYRDLDYTVYLAKIK